MTKRDALLERLRAGAGAGDAALRVTMATGDDDRALAAALLEHISEEVPRLASADPEPAPRPSTASDPSFLSRLGAGGRDIANIDDLDTLFGVLEGGNLAQRRAAALRIEACIEAGELAPEQLERVETALASPRDPDVAWEVLRARGALPGAAGRDVRNERDAFEALVERLRDQVRAFWEEDRPREPLSELGAEDLATLALLARELPDAITAHVAAVLEGSDGPSDVAARVRLASVLRSSADPRLVPAFASLVTGRSSELAREAVRALGRIDDPRVRPVLVRALERSADPAMRALAAGALGLGGDARGLGLLREMIDTGDRQAQRAAVEGIVEIATLEDVDRLVRLLPRADRGLVVHAVRALGHIGDGRAVGPLRARASQEPPAVIAEEIVAALRCITAQMELRGEGAPPADAGNAAIVSKKAPLRPTDRAGFWVRFVAGLDVLVGRIWLAMGASERALGAFESAATRRPGWAVPHTAIALAQVRRGRPAPALAAFRRALSSDRGYIETQSRVVRTLARTFLRRAEEMERSGRRDVALGLLEEVVALDLRRVEEPVRFEIARRAERLRAEVAT
jgi:HEAT repeat protein